MDSIMRDDDDKNEKQESDQFKTKELKIGEEIEVEASVEEDEVVVIRNGRAFEKEREKERKKRLAELLPDKVFAPPKIGKKKPACLSCFVIFTVVMLIFLMIILFWGNKILYQDIFLKEPISTPEITLNPLQKKSLDIKIRKFEEALKRYEADETKNEVEVSITGSQLNYLISQLEQTDSRRQKIYVRVFPNDNNARIEISIPYKASRFINFYIEGIPAIDFYKFDMNVFSLRVGNISKAMGIKDRLINQINREIDIYLLNYNLPFRIKSMKIEDNKINATLILRPGEKKEENTQEKK